MATTYDSILKSLKKKDYAPVYFLTGEEPYFIDQLTNYVAQKVLNEGERDFNQTVFYGKDADMDNVLSAARRYPMMAEKQVVIVKEAQDLKNLDSLERYLENPVPTTLLLFAWKHKKLDKRLKVAKLLTQKSVFFESKKIKENQLGPWIQDKFTEKGYNISPKAVYLLTEFVGSDLEKLINTADKLQLAKTETKIISESDIEEHVGISKEYNIFELQKALGSKNLHKAMLIMQYLKANQKTFAIPMITGMLYNYFSKLFVVEGAKGSPKEIAKEAGIPPFYVSDYQKGVANFKGRLPEAMEILLEYDLKFKGVGAVNYSYENLIDEMIYRLLDL